MGSKISKEGIVSASGSGVNPNLVTFGYSRNPRMQYTAGSTILSVTVNDYYTRYTCTTVGSGGGKFDCPMGNGGMLVQGKTYTWSCDVRASQSLTGVTSTRFGFEGGGQISSTDFKIGTEWQRLTKTWTQTTSQAFTIYPAGCLPENAWIDVRNLKVEEGSIATPYCLPIYESFLEFDHTFYTEGSYTNWVRIFHHANPAYGRFASTDPFTSKVNIDENRWFHISLCNYFSDSFELMVRQKDTPSSTEVKYRWVQTVNPMVATFNETVAANITRNTASGYSTASYGGLYKKNSNTYLAGNNGTESNWMGAVGSWTAWSTGIPGFYSGPISTGYMDVYLRLDNKDMKLNPTLNPGLLESNIYPGKVGNDWIQANEFIEI